MTLPVALLAPALASLVVLGSILAVLNPVERVGMGSAGVSFDARSAHAVR